MCMTHCCSCGVFGGWPYRAFEVPPCEPSFPFPLPHVYPAVAGREWRTRVRGFVSLLRWRRYAIFCLSLSPVSYGLTFAKVAAIHAWRTRTGPSAVRRRPTATALVPCRRTLLVSPYPTGPGEARTLIALSYSPFSRRSSSGSLRTRQKSRTS